MAAGDRGSRACHAAGVWRSPAPGGVLPGEGWAGPLCSWRELGLVRIQPLQTLPAVFFPRSPVCCWGAAGFSLGQGCFGCPLLSPHQVRGLFCSTFGCLLPSSSLCFCFTPLVSQERGRPELRLGDSRSGRLPAGWRQEKACEVDETDSGAGPRGSYTSLQGWSWERAQRGSSHLCGDTYGCGAGARGAWSRVVLSVPDPGGPELGAWLAGVLASRGSSGLPGFEELMAAIVSRS